MAVKTWFNPFGFTLKNASSTLPYQLDRVGSTPHISCHSPGGKTAKLGRAIARVAKRSDLASSSRAGWLYLRLVSFRAVVNRIMGQRGIRTRSVSRLSESIHRGRCFRPRRLGSSLSI